MKAALKTIVYFFLISCILSFTFYYNQNVNKQLFLKNSETDTPILNFSDTINNLYNDFNIIGCWKQHIDPCDFIWELRPDNSFIFNYDCDYSNGVNIYQWEYKGNIFTEITEKETTNYILEWKNANCFILKNKKNNKGQDNVFARTVCPHGDPQGGQGSNTNPKLQSKKEILENSVCSLCNGTSWKNCPDCKGTGGKYEQEQEQVQERVYDYDKRQYEYKWVYKYVDKWKRCQNYCELGKVRCNHR